MATSDKESTRTPQEYEVLSGGGAESAELAKQGLTRRQLLRGAVGLTAGLIGIESLGAGLVMIYPTIVGKFGSKITLQTKDKYPAAKPADFTINNGKGVFYEAEALSYICHLSADTPWLLHGQELQNILDAEWIVKDPTDGTYWIAIYQRCVHLGCKFNFRDDCYSFKCPCHGSHYNCDGEYLSGPAPRSNDRFLIDISGKNIVVDTGKLNQSVQHPSPTTLLLTELASQLPCNT
jgi:cytochrome b6-f complex iron-sulfur subunit